MAMTIYFVCKIDLVVKYSLVSLMAYPCRLLQSERECFCPDNISKNIKIIINESKYIYIYI